MTRARPEAPAPIAAAIAEAVKATAVGAAASVEAVRIAAQASTDAARALSEMKAHQEVCVVKDTNTSKQIEQIIKSQDKADIDRAAMHTANQESIRRLYALLWRLVLGVSAACILTLVGWVAVLLWYVVTKGA